MKYKAAPVLFLLFFLGTGCITTDYVGKTYTPTNSVDLYFDEADIDRPYEVMGEIKAETDNNNLFKTTEKMQAKLIAMAQERGADGLIMGALDVRQTGETTSISEETKVKGRKAQTNGTSTTTAQEVKTLRARLIKYKTITAAN